MCRVMRYNGIGVLYSFRRVLYRVVPHIKTFVISVDKNSASNSVKKISWKGLYCIFTLCDHGFNFGTEGFYCSPLFEHFRFGEER